VQIDIQENFFGGSALDIASPVVCLAPTMGGMLSAFAVKILMTQAR
jgi:hypothetical protein